MKLGEFIFLKKLNERSGKKETSDLYISDFSADKSEVTLGSSITLKTTAIGSGTITYKFEYTRSGTNWATIQDYSTSSVVDWTPKYIGTYTVIVHITDGINIAQKDISITVIGNAENGIPNQEIDSTE